MTGACVCVFVCRSWMPVTLQGELVATDSVLLWRPAGRRTRVDYTLSSQHISRGDSRFLFQR